MGDYIEKDCPDCGGTGYAPDGGQCDRCGGTGEIQIIDGVER